MHRIKVFLTPSPDAPKLVVNSKANLIKNTYEMFVELREIVKP